MLICIGNPNHRVSSLSYRRNLSKKRGFSYSNVLNCKKISLLKKFVLIIFSLYLSSLIYWPKWKLENCLKNFNLLKIHNKNWWVVPFARRMLVHIYIHILSNSVLKFALSLICTHIRIGGTPALVFFNGRFTPVRVWYVFWL